MILLAFVVLGFGGGLLGCHPNSKSLHVCLNIYLEKDYPFLETLIEPKGGGHRRGRILLEDRDLTLLCGHLSSLHDCYGDLLPECNSYWQLERYARLMRLLNTTRQYLCSGYTKTLKDLLTNTECLQSGAKLVVSGCSDEIQFSWIDTWKGILRLQASPADRCGTMEEYRDCLIDRLPSTACGEGAAVVYGSLMDLWLKSWCNRNSSLEDALAYMYSPVNSFEGR